MTISIDSYFYNNNFHPGSEVQRATSRLMTDSQMVSLLEQGIYPNPGEIWNARPTEGMPEIFLMENDGLNAIIINDLKLRMKRGNQQFAPLVIAVDSHFDLNRGPVNMATFRRHLIEQQVTPTVILLTRLNQDEEDGIDKYVRVFHVGNYRVPGIDLSLFYDDLGENNYWATRVLNLIKKLSIQASPLIHTVDIDACTCTGFQAGFPRFMDIPTRILSRLPKPNIVTIALSLMFEHHTEPGLFLCQAQEYIRFYRSMPDGA